MNSGPNPVKALGDPLTGCHARRGAHDQHPVPVDIPVSKRGEYGGDKPVLPTNGVALVEHPTGILIQSLLDLHRVVENRVL